MRSLLPNHFPPIIYFLIAIVLAYFLYGPSTVKKIVELPVTVKPISVVEKHAVAPNSISTHRHMASTNPNARASLEFQMLTINKCKVVGYRIPKIQAQGMTNIDAGILSAFCNPTYARR